jgi:hypothetical protein
MNKFEKRYVNDLLKNHPLDSASSTNNYDSLANSTDSIGLVLAGGSDETIPDGCFPPIFMCGKTEVKDEENKNREYSKHKNSVTIQQIMAKRRNTTPFIAQQ